MKQLTIADIVKFIIKHRRFCGCFNDWSIADIAIAIKEAIGINAAFCSVNTNGEINGFGMGYIEDISKLYFHTTAIVTSDKQAFPALMRRFKEFWPNWTITANRKGRRVVYKNTNKLISKVIAYG